MRFFDIKIYADKAFFTPQILFAEGAEQAHGFLFAMGNEVPEGVEDTGFNSSALI